MFYGKVYRPIRNAIRWWLSGMLSTQHLEAALIERDGVIHNRLETGQSENYALYGPATFIMRNDPP